MVFVLALCYINVFCEVGNCHYWGWHELFVQFHEILFMPLMFSVRSEIVITGVGMNSLCNFTKYYSCEISLNVNFKANDSNISSAAYKVIFLL